MLCRNTREQCTPVFPLVGSTSVVTPGLMAPDFSASSIMFFPIRSFTLQQGSIDSILATTWATQPSVTELRYTSGVFPMTSVTLLQHIPGEKTGVQTFGTAGLDQGICQIMTPHAGGAGRSYSAMVVPTGLAGFVMGSAVHRTPLRMEQCEGGALGAAAGRRWPAILYPAPVGTTILLVEMYKDCGILENRMSSEDVTVPATLEQQNAITPSLANCRSEGSPEIVIQAVEMTT